MQLSYRNYLKFFILLSAATVTFFTSNLRAGDYTPPWRTREQAHASAVSYVGSARLAYAALAKKVGERCIVCFKNGGKSCDPENYYDTGYGHVGEIHTWAFADVICK